MRGRNDQYGLIVLGHISLVPVITYGTIREWTVRFSIERQCVASTNLGEIRILSQCRAQRFDARAQSRNSRSGLRLVIKCSVSRAQPTTAQNAYRGHGA